MSYLPSSAIKIIFFVSEIAALCLTLPSIRMSDEYVGLRLIVFFICYSLVFNASIFGTVAIVKALKNMADRDMMRTELMKDEYYRMEARKRLDKESK